jgi:hypothetical protein
MTSRSPPCWRRRTTSPVPPIARRTPADQPTPSANSRVPRRVAGVAHRGIACGYGPDRGENESRINGRWRTIPPSPPPQRPEDRIAVGVNHRVRLGLSRRGPRRWYRQTLGGTAVALLDGGTMPAPFFFFIGDLGQCTQCAALSVEHVRRPGAHLNSEQRSLPPRCSGFPAAG